MVVAVDNNLVLFVVVVYSVDEEDGALFLMLLDFCSSFG